MRSLQELEILHKQAELEQAYLEQALALSLAIEEERLRLSRPGLSETDDIQMKSCSGSDKNKKFESTQAETKVD